MKFNSANEMLSYIQSGRDLYSPSTNLYVFLYSELGSICVYNNITPSTAAKLDSEDDYWGAYLGWQGSAIWDSEEYVRENEGENSVKIARELFTLADQWCEEAYLIDDWKDVTK